MHQSLAKRDWPIRTGPRRDFTSNQDARLSRYNPNHSHSEATLAAARLWRDRCLIEDGSVFSDERLWSSEVLAEVDAHFNGRPDASKDRFQTKLHRQFQDASPRACRLVAEMLWAMNLFPSNIGPVSKRDAIRDVWSWSGHVLSDDHELIDRGTLKGLGSAGPGFLAHRPREVRFFIHAMIAFKAFSVDERRALLDDAWRFAEWLDAVPDEGYRQLKHILPFLLFPDQFERIASPGDIRRILIGLGGFDRRALKQVSKVDQDRALLDLRHKIEEDEGRELDFYDSKFREIWAPDDEPVEPSETRRSSEDWPSAHVASASRPPLNQILYGPPGTGKTYQTIERALQILDPEFALANKSDREALKLRFDELTSDGLIQFVTFHQSFGYEDFVEGLRAEVRADGSINYYVANGVLKAFCESTSQGPRLAAGTTFASGYVVTRSTDEILWLDKPNGSSLPLPWAIIDGLKAMLDQGVITLTDVREKTVFERAPDSRLEKYIVNGYNNLLPHILDAVTSEKRCIPQRPSVLIIDEINRGNVSKIFGELITLIEQSKRAGATEALSATLPYSKTKFSLPSGLHIIGTMNTADRSLATIDIALRRRFVFVEVEPDSSTLEGVEIAGVDVAKLLDTINARIEALLDRDHRLGHAYFIGLTADDDVRQLKHVFATQIIPLLQEYFFDDWQRIRLVFNDHRKATAEDRFVLEQGDGASQLFGDDNLEAPTAKSWRINADALNRPSAYQLIMS